MVNKKIKIVAIGGYSGSGKTTFSKLLRKKGYKVFSVSQTFKQFVAKKKPNFYSLEEKDRIKEGMKLIRKDPYLPGKLLYNKAGALKKDYNKEYIVIDGVRCLRDISFFNKSKLRIILIYSSFPLRVRNIRLMRKEKISENFLKKRDLLDISVGFGEVIRTSNYTIINDGKKSKKDLINDFLNLEKSGFNFSDNKNIFKGKNLPNYILREVENYESKIERLRK